MPLATSFPSWLILMTTKFLYLSFLAIYHQIFFLKAGKLIMSVLNLFLMLFIKRVYFLKQLISVSPNHLLVFHINFLLSKEFFSVPGSCFCYLINSFIVFGTTLLHCLQIINLFLISFKFSQQIFLLLKYLFSKCILVKFHCI